MAVNSITASSNHMNSTATKALFGATEAEVPRAAYTIPEFCTAHRISQAMYFKLRAAGFGPREMRAGRRVTVSLEAAVQWRRARETAPTGSNPETARDGLVRA
jgi:hypothetical protein